MSHKSSKLDGPSGPKKPKFNSANRRKRVVPLSYQLFGAGLNIASWFRNEWAAKILCSLWFTVFKSKQKPWIKEFWQQADDKVEIQLEGKTIPVYIWGRLNPISL